VNGCTPASTVYPSVTIEQLVPAIDSQCNARASHNLLLLLLLCLYLQGVFPPGTFPSLGLPDGWYCESSAGPLVLPAQQCKISTMQQQPTTSSNEHIMYLTS
jgi:hypothetical protein